MVDWKAIRSEFPALANWTFLNSATIGQLPRRTIERVNQHFARRDEFACLDLFDWFYDADAVRGSIAQLIHCQAEDIAFLPNASTALALLVNGVEWQPGDRIITLQNEFPNQYYYSQLLSRHGVEFVEAPFQALENALTDRTRMVAISTVSYSSGFRVPLDRIAGILRDRGILFYLDGTQNLGALDIDMGDVQPDIFAVDGYKWLLCPQGAAFMYVKPSVRQWLKPHVVGWRSHKNWRDPENLHHGSPDFSPDAERYEGGMLGFASIYAMGASVEMILEIGIQEIEARVMYLASLTAGVMRRAGAAVSDVTSPIVTGCFPGQDPSKLVARMREKHVLITARRGNLRVSPHFYNNEEDIERFEQCLRSLS